MFIFLFIDDCRYEAYKYEGTVISVDVQTPNKAMRDGKPVVAVVRAALGYGLPPLVSVGSSVCNGWFWNANSFHLDGTVDGCWNVVVGT